MKRALEYRAYRVSFEGGFYIAKSLDGEPGQLVSKHLLRVLRSIDVLWETLNTGMTPEWVATFLNGSTPHCDLDACADALSPSHPEECGHDSRDPLASVHRFFPGSPKPALAVAAAA